MASWFWGSNPFDEAVDKATSELNVSGAEDIALNLEICDQIRSKSVGPKEAMRSIKRRLNHQNPNVQLLTLSLLDICIKNGGDHFLVEIASREFMDNLVSILKLPALNRDVKTKSLRLVQNWAIGFEGKPSLSYVGEVYKTLQREGFTFPPKDSVAANSAMVDTSTAPEWIDSDVCLRCRTPFSFTNRKHHCRNCGQVFDQACSSKNLPLPHFGITQEVRVCDTCFFKLKKKSISAPSSDAKHHRSHSLTHGAQRTKHKSVQEMEDEELQRAIALSLREPNPTLGRAGYVPAAGPTAWQVSEPPISAPASGRFADSEEDDPELRAAIEASIREANEPKPSAPFATAPQEEAQQASSANTLDLLPLEEDAILSFSQTVEEARARGTRDFVRYPGVSELYNKAHALRPKLDVSLDDTSRKEQYLSEMHEKLSEAVKLYDQLLTAQLNPIRGQRSQPVQAPSGHPPYMAQSVSSHPIAPPQPEQWNSASHPPSAVSVAPPTAPQTAPTPASLPQASYVPPSQYQEVYPSVAPQAFNTVAPVSAPQHLPPVHPGFGFPPKVASPPPLQPTEYAPFQSPNVHYDSVGSQSAISNIHSPSPYGAPAAQGPAPSGPYQPIVTTHQPFQAPTAPQPTPSLTTYPSVHPISPVGTNQPSMFPLFPAAPTAQPQSLAYSPYDSQGSLEQKEQKEALLISFD